MDQFLINYAKENIWLSQKRMAELFDCNLDAISLQPKSVYKKYKLEETATTDNFSVVKEIEPGK